MKRTYVLLISFLFISFSILMADTDRATISGMVSDPSGATVSDAKVTLNYPNTGYTRTSVTARDGSYTFAVLPAGTVILTIEKSGFRTVKYDKVDLDAGQILKLDVQLPIAASTETIDVRGVAAALNETSAEIGSVTVSEQIANMPLNGRSWQTLLALTPGAINQGTGVASEIRFNGHGVDDNNLQFDGVDATGVRNQVPRGDIRLAISLESISEIRVRSGEYTAESGDTTAAQINVISKSGSNNFHGSAFEYLRNDALDIRGPFDLSLPPFHLNQFGASLGGPLRENKAFFFMDYEGLRQDMRLYQQGLVPNSSFRAAALAMSPEIAPLLNAYPVGMTPVDANTDNWQAPLAETNNQDSGLFRLDYRINEHASVFARYSTDKMRATTPSGDSYPQLQNTTATNGVVEFSYIFSQDTLNDFRAGINRNPFDRVYTNPLIPALQVTGFMTLNGASDGLQDSTSYTIVDNFTRVLGRHTLKAGIEIRPLNFALRSIADGSTLTYASPTALENNQLTNATLNGYLPFVAVAKTQYFWYGQDEWRVSPRLTLNLGLRYEKLNVLRQPQHRDMPFDIEGCGGYCATGSKFTNPSPNDFAPRIGLAWRPFGENTVVRAGFGMYFGEGQLGNETSPVENLTTRAFVTASEVTPQNFSELLQAAPPADLATVTDPIDQQLDRRDMYTSQWSLSVQRTLLGGFVAQATYLGSEGTQMFMRKWVNLPDPVTNVAPLPQYGILSFKGFGSNSSFHALQLALSSHQYNGLTLSANYQLAHAIDENSPGGDDASQIMITSCPKCDKASSTFDARHTFNLNAFYILPFGKGKSLLNSGVASKILGGWGLAGIASARSGMPINVTVTRAQDDIPDRDSRATERPDLVPGVSIYPAHRTINNWLNLNAFAVPASGTWGDAGRNIALGPNLVDLDAAVQRKFLITERVNLDARAEVFNLANHPQYANPNANISSPSSFGVITQTVNTGQTGTGLPRQFEFSLRLNF
jgi:hypothetical protein